MKSQFQRRAAEMKAHNIEQRQFRTLPPRRSVFATPRMPAPAKVYVRDFLRDADIDQLNPELFAVRKLRTLETDRDGLLDLATAAIRVSVSPELLLRGIKVYDAAVKGAVERGWPLEMIEGKMKASAPPH